MSTATPRAEIEEVVERLVAKLRISEGGKEDYVKLLLSGITDNNVPTIAYEKVLQLVRERNDPSGFQDAYARLYAKDVPELDRLMTVVARIASDKSLTALLATGRHLQTSRSRMISGPITPSVSAKTTVTNPLASPMESPALSTIGAHSTPSSLATPSLNFRAGRFDPSLETPSQSGLFTSTVAQDPLSPSSRMLLDNESKRRLSASDFSSDPTLIHSLGKDDAPPSPGSDLRIRTAVSRIVKGDQPTVHGPAFEMERSRDQPGSLLKENHVVDLSTVHFGSSIRIRSGAYPRYLVVRTSYERLPEANKQRLVMRLAAQGDGLRGEEESFELVHAAEKASKSPVKFGDVVALRSTQGQGRYLAVDMGTGQLILRRNQVIGQAEKWTLVDASLDAPSAQVTSHGARSKQPPRCVQNGDRLAFYSATAGGFITLVGDASRELEVRVRSVSEIDGRGLEIWQAYFSSTPYTPLWDRDRPYLSGAFLISPCSLQLSGGEKKLILRDYPLSLQESTLIEDLLSALMGIEGRFVRIKGSATGRHPNTLFEAEFAVDSDSMDPSLGYLVERALPLCNAYIHVKHYIETRSRHEYGLVAHALTAALKSLLKEYLVLIAQLEHQNRAGQLSLQKLWFFVQPSLRTLQILEAISLAARDVAGGALLNVIHRTAALGGDERSRNIYNFLMQKAVIPYLRMLGLWLYTGEVQDPYDEFMIQEDKQLRKEEMQEDPWSRYWTNRYTVREHQVAVFLSNIKEKIFTTGKYLNVVRECGIAINCPHEEVLGYSPVDRHYEERVDVAHRFASKLLLDLLLENNQLLARLKSIKHYFLMDQGDFFVDFMDVAEKELNRRAGDLAAERLDSLLQLSLQTSTCAIDPFKDNLHARISPFNLIFQMDQIHSKEVEALGEVSFLAGNAFKDPGYKGIDAFTLDYRVDWPLSLVISAGAIHKYQLIFRHLFFCKHVERKLCDSWMNHQATKELNLRAALGSSYCLRQRMLHFQQNFVYYMMFEVIEPRWHDFEARLKQATTVDQVLALHKDFQDTCLKECLLTEQELLKVLTKLMIVCLNFAVGIERFTRPFALDDESVKEEAEQARARRIAKAAELENPTRTDGRAPRRRASSVTDLRTSRIKQLSSDVERALTEKSGGGGENPFVRMIEDMGKKFDSLLAEFMQKLLNRSHLQVLTDLAIVDIQAR